MVAGAAELRFLPPRLSIVFLSFAAGATARRGRRRRVARYTAQHHPTPCMETVRTKLCRCAKLLNVVDQLLDGVNQLLDVVDQLLNVRSRRSASGCRRSASGCRRSASGCRRSASGCRRSIYGCRGSASGCRQSHRCSVDNCPLKDAGRARK